MFSSRSRGTQGSAFLGLVLIILALWYEGKLPGIPSPNQVLPTEFQNLGTGIPNSSNSGTEVPNPSDSGNVITGNSTAVPLAPGQAPAWGNQGKTSGCAAHNGLPDSACTPGDIL